MKNFILQNEEIRAHILRESQRPRNIDDILIEGILEEFALVVEGALTASFEKAAEPLMRFMSGLHPHHVAHVEVNRAELLEGQKSYVTDDFIVD